MYLRNLTFYVGIVVFRVIPIDFFSNKLFLFITKAFLTSSDFIHKKSHYTSDTYLSTHKDFMYLRIYTNHKISNIVSAAAVNGLSSICVKPTIEKFNRFYLFPQNNRTSVKFKILQCIYIVNLIFKSTRFMVVKGLLLCAVNS